MESAQLFIEETVLNEGNVLTEENLHMPASVQTNTSKLEADCMSFIENKWKLISIIT